MQGSQVVKNMPASEGGIKSWDSIPRLGRSLFGEGMASHSVFWPGESWTEELGGLWSLGSHTELDTTGTDLAHMLAHRLM